MTDRFETMIETAYRYFSMLGLAAALMTSGGIALRLLLEPHSLPIRLLALIAVPLFFAGSIVVLLRLSLVSVNAVAENQRQWFWPCKTPQTIAIFAPVILAWAVSILIGAYAIPGILT